ncbi:uncharacterized protein LOC120430652 [Culex pipiens pallens]|uniref:uncharacterized protein LOC120430652 n=1 Tax=Culex pipiens pallens TaxID=42434 RepID=UPI001952AF8D|nr:uncharacterized protein LOC120430652 [Culex pipiens pallens]
MDSTATDCSKCHQAIKAAAFFRCNGICGSSFHMHCTSSTQQQMRSVQDVPNLFWRCDGCVVTMETPEYRTAFRALCEALRSVSETHTKAFEEVKAELVETNNKIDQLISKLPEPKTAPTWPSNKRRRSRVSGPSSTTTHQFDRCRRRSTKCTSCLNFTSPFQDFAKNYASSSRSVQELCLVRLARIPSLAGYA